jgi:hypothetical protein
MERVWSANIHAELRVLRKKTVVDGGKRIPRYATVGRPDCDAEYVGPAQSAMPMDDDERPLDEELPLLNLYVLKGDTTNWEIYKS